MSEITVSESKDYFIKDGKPFFYLADTIWMAFSKLSESEWRDYLHYRKVQGFNVVQVSLSLWIMTTVRMRMSCCRL